MVLAGLLGTGQSWAAVPVEDMSTRDIRSSALTEQVPLSGAGAAGAGLPGGAAADAATNPGQNAQLFYELQVLQSELQQLRGLVEDQAYEISRLRDLQRSQYLDIDRRLIEDGHPVAQISAPPTGPAAQAPVREPVVQVQTAQGSTGSQQPVVESSVAVTAAALPAPTPVLETATTPAATNPEAKPGSETETQLVPSEQLAFERAFELMKEQQFEQSITAYQRVVEGFPDGNYAPESRYWLGELYLMSDRLEAARGSFASVVEVYPAHQKVPLSLYKLGVVNHRLGATPAALEYLDNVVTRYPDTPAAGLARTYAAELR